MSEIPEDVLNIADEAYGYAIMLHQQGNDPIPVIARAILAERERCAEIANRQVQANNTGSGFDSHVAYSTAWNIRDEIQFPAHSQALPISKPKATKDATA